MIQTLRIILAGVLRGREGAAFAAMCVNKSDEEALRKLAEMNTKAMREDLNHTSLNLPPASEAAACLRMLKKDPLASNTGYIDIRGVR